jgi:regulator of protease activity HflC (stomatin/prohibitin superfamily)
MMFYRKIKVASHERALVFREGEFDSVLTPGKNKLFDPLRKLAITRVNLRDVYFKHENLDVLAREFLLRQSLGGEVRVVDLADHERAFVFIDGKFDRILKPGLHVLWVALRKVRVEVVDTREPVYASADLPRIVRGNTLEDEATVLDLADHQRGLVWVDGRFRVALRPGLYLLWKGMNDVRVEVADASAVMFNHRELSAILQTGSQYVLNQFTIDAGQVGLWFIDGKLGGVLKPGTHAFWTGVGKLKLLQVELRERTLDISGQEIMTNDKVTLRMNALLTYRVADALKSVTVTEDAAQALYREAQLALRAVVGARELDALLTDKDAVAAELEALVKAKAPEFGLEVRSLGIRDIILPGEMKELMNKVTEARKAAEASLINRREETAAMRMQANTAKILENQPVLMKMRELEVLEKIAEKSNLTVVLGESGGLNDRVMKLL